MPATQTDGITDPSQELNSLDGANGQNRTDDPRFTKALLYRLSYVGVPSTGEPPTPALPRLAATVLLITDSPRARKGCWTDGGGVVNQ